MKKWRASGGTLDYVGEWHTHPEQQPVPSRLDLEQWLAIHGARSGIGMIFIIVGSASQNWYGVGQGQFLRRVHLAPSV